MRSRAHIRIFTCSVFRSCGFPSFSISEVTERVAFHFFFVVYSIGEESYSSGTRPPLTDLPTFCVDPIGKLPAFHAGAPHLTFSSQRAKN